MSVISWEEPGFKIQAARSDEGVAYVLTERVSLNESCQCPRRVREARIVLADLRNGARACIGPMLVSGV